MKYRQVRHQFRPQTCVSAMMIEKIIVVAPTTAVPISTGFAVALNVLPAPSFSSRFSLPLSKWAKSRTFSDIAFDARKLLDRRKLIHRLRIIGDRTIRIDRNCHRPHSQKPKCNQTKREHCRREHKLPRGQTYSRYSHTHRTPDGDPSQYALKLPATKPERMFSERRLPARPSRLRAHDRTRLT